MVSTAAGLGALLHVLGVAPLLKGLPGHVLLDILTLLPGGGGALPAGGAGAVFLVHILGDGGGNAAANFLRDFIANLTGSRHVITNLEEVRNEVRNTKKLVKTTRKICKDLTIPAWGPGCTSCW